MTNLPSHSGLLFYYSAEIIYGFTFCHTNHNTAHGMKWMGDGLWMIYNLLQFYYTVIWKNYIYNIYIYIYKIIVYKYILYTKHKFETQPVFVLCIYRQGSMFLRCPIYGIVLSITTSCSNSHFTFTCINIWFAFIFIAFNVYL